MGSRCKSDRVYRPFKQRHIPRSRIQWRGSHTCRRATYPRLPIIRRLSGRRGSGPDGQRIYREVVGSSRCFRAPETKNDTPGGNRAHQTAIHLRHSVPESDVRTFRVKDGRSPEGRTVFMVRSTPNFHGPHVKVSQRASTPRFVDVFWDVLEGSVLRVDRPVFRIV